jgi:hypothetical protein
LRTGQLTPAANDDGMEKIFEERMRAAKEQIGYWPNSATRI